MKKESVDEESIVNTEKKVVITERHLSKFSCLDELRLFSDYRFGHDKFPLDKNKTHQAVAIQSRRFKSLNLPRMR